MIATPIIMSKILYAKRDSLSNEDTINTYGTLYVGKNIEEPSRNYVWVYPLTFFFRRTIFMIVTVFLFE